MFNVAVIKLKDIVKYLMTLIIIVIVIYGINRYFFYNKKIQFKDIDILGKLANSINNYILYPINTEIPVINITNKNGNTNISEINNLIDENKENADEEFMTNVFTSMIGAELTIINSEINVDDNIDSNKNLANSKDANNTIEEIDKQQSGDEENNQQENNQQENEFTSVQDGELELAKTDVKTEVVTENPIAETYTDEYNGVKIKNETSFELTNDVLDASNLDIDCSNIMIFHTHTCESYTSSEKYSYKATGNFRTTDLNYTVARVGDELTQYLTQYGFNTIHDKTYHDYPAYSGSYTRSFSTVSKLLETTSADIIIDLHRDAIGSYSSYAPTVKIGDDYCAQIMFVMGTNGGGLNHPNWQSNLKFAVKMQEIANNMYPGLFKPIILRNSRYNQNLGKAACIIEVGSTGNTLEQCLNSMKYFSEVMNKFSALFI